MSLSKNFLLGAATAAHQVEGNNIYSDCWAQENMKHSSYCEPSLDAVDHYTHYREDIALLAEAGMNAYRFSIEWARIEPQEGCFDPKEVQHYRDMLICCHEHGVEPVVTLHHFSSPKWLIQRGGWAAESTIDFFSRYCSYVVKELGDLMHYVCTFNEANMGVHIAMFIRRFQESQAKLAKQGNGNLQLGVNVDELVNSRNETQNELRELFGSPAPSFFVVPRTQEQEKLIMHAHTAACDAIKSVRPDLKIGLTLSLHDIQAMPGCEEQAASDWHREFGFYLPYICNDDFIGVQNYTRLQVGESGVLPVPDGAETTQMRYEFYPESLEHVVRKVASEFNGELLVTENGVATDNDERRVAFIERVMQGVERCVADGLPLKGYFYWSLFDNFEWEKGYSMKFGLIAVNRSTQQRLPKPSFRYLAEYKTK